MLHIIITTHTSPQHVIFYSPHVQLNSHYAESQNYTFLLPLQKMLGGRKQLLFPPHIQDMEWLTPQWSHTVSYLNVHIIPAVVHHEKPCSQPFTTRDHNLGLSYPLNNSLATTSHGRLPHQDIAHDNNYTYQSTDHHYNPPQSSFSRSLFFSHFATFFFFLPPISFS